MAEAKKPSYPSKPCPKCKELIHARSQSHEACGWVMRKSKPAAAKAASSTKRKVGRPAGSKSNVGNISVQDIQAVKALTDKIGAAKVKQIADVLA